MLKKVVISLLLLSGMAFAKDKGPIPPLGKGILLAFSDAQSPYLIGGETPQDSLIIQRHSFSIVIAVNEIAYTASMGRHYIPKTMIMGDPIDAAVNADHLYFKLPSGKIFRATITQRARYKPDDKK